MCALLMTELPLIAKLRKARSSSLQPSGIRITPQGTPSQAKRCARAEFWFASTPPVASSDLFTLASAGEYKVLLSKSSPCLISIQRASRSKERLDVSPLRLIPYVSINSGGTPHDRKWTGEPQSLPGIFNQPPDEVSNDRPMRWERGLRQNTTMTECRPK